MPDSLVGRSLGPYRIVAPLGAGGMGEVFVASDARLGRRVALKILPPDVGADASRRARFVAEARDLEIYLKKISGGADINLTNARVTIESDLWLMRR